MRNILILLALVVPHQGYAECDSMRGSLFESCLEAASAKDIEKEMAHAIYKIEKRFKNYPQPEYSKLVLINSQEAWLKFRSKQCKFEQHLFGGANSVSVVRCMNRMNSERLIELQKYVEK